MTTPELVQSFDEEQATLRRRLTALNFDLRAARHAMKDASDTYHAYFVSVGGSTEDSGIIMKRMPKVQTTKQQDEMLARLHATFIRTYSHFEYLQNKKHALINEIVALLDFH
jgi:hypothetical protein